MSKSVIQDFNALRILKIHLFKNENRYLKIIEYKWFDFFTQWYINRSSLFYNKATLAEEHQWYYLTHRWRDKGGFIPFLRVFVQKWT